MSLKELRDQIDAIDREGIALLTKRMEVARQIALIKKRDRLPIWDLERELALMEAVRRCAQEQKLSPLMVEEIFRLILSYTKQEMKRSAGVQR